MKPLNILTNKELENYINEITLINIKLFKLILKDKTPGLVGTRKFLLNNVKDGILCMELAQIELSKRRFK